MTAPKAAFSMYILGILLSISAQAMNVAYIGDSQSATKSTFLDQLLIELGDVNVASGTAVCGASIEAYTSRVHQGRCAGTGHMRVTDGNATYYRDGGRTEYVSNFLTSDIDAVVIQLGDNNIGGPDSADPKIAAKARALVSAIKAKGKKCVWITPAATSAPNCGQSNLRKQRISTAIREALTGSDCKVIDSHALTTGKQLSNGRECLHYNSASYKKWAQAVAPQLKQALSGGKVSPRSVAPVPARTSSAPSAKPSGRRVPEPPPANR